MAIESIYIALWHRGKFEPAGQILFDQEAWTAAFRYLNGYEGPPVDPVSLDYRKAGTRLFKVDTRYNVELIHRVFQDFMPGSWGMDILMAEYPDLRKMTKAEQLYWMGSRTVGGMASMVAPKVAGESPPMGLDHLSRIRKDSIEFHAKKLQAILSRRDHWGLCSHGGARPKTSFVDENGDHWLCKFNLDLDGFNGARVEHALLEMSREAGINAAHSKVVTLPDGEEVLFVKRFDRAGDNRMHQISLFAMMDETRVRMPTQADYQDAIQVVKDVSGEEDAIELFTRMLFNVAVNNTDDHARNFSMLLQEDGQYRLSPSFDITPNIHPYPHAMSIGGQPRTSLKDDALEIMARRFGIPIASAYAIRDRVSLATADYQSKLTHYGVSEKDVVYLERAFAGYGKSGMKPGK